MSRIDSLRQLTESVFVRLFGYAPHAAIQAPAGST